MEKLYSVVHAGCNMLNSPAQYTVCGKILGFEGWFKLGKLHLFNRNEKRRSKTLGKWHGCYFFIFERSLLSTHKNNVIPVARISLLALIFVSGKELIPVSDGLVKSIGFGLSKNFSACQGKCNTVAWVQATHQEKPYT